MSKNKRIIKKEEYFTRLAQGVPVGDCWVDMGNGELAYALYEVVVISAPVSKYGDRTFLLHDICAIAVADNTRVDTRQRDIKIREAENAMEKERKKKELVGKVKSIVNKYYDNEIKQFPDQEALLVSGKLRFNREIITKDRFYHYDFPAKLMTGVDGETIKELITISGGNFTDEDPRFRQTYLSQYEPSWSEKWSESDNILAKVSYNIANDVYVILQVFSCDLLNKIWDRGERINELTGGAARINLNGSTNYSPIDNFVNFMPQIISLGTSSVMNSIPHGLGYVSKLNAAQFSKVMSKMPPSLKSSLYKAKIRGALNRWSNKAINYWDNQISNGIILFKVKSLRPIEDMSSDKER
jgi:hypothetical protein